jgi:DNA invertase Pin-like site-specific DNA recombinase
MKQKRNHPVHKPEPDRPVLWHGYARVSTDDQDLRMQIDALIRDGVDPERIYQDKRSGKNTNRTGLQDMLAHVRSGEGIKVWRFDRLSRSIRDLIMIFDDLEARGIQLKSLHEQLDTTTPMGRLMFQLAGILAEFERNLIAERTRHGMKAARDRGRRPGPARKLDDAKVDKIIQQLRVRQTDRKAVGELAKKFGCSTTTLRDRVVEKTGKRLWPKGPRAKR